MFAQTEGQDILSHFSVSQVGNQIRVSLTIEAGESSCQGIELERKVESGLYEVIDMVPGICGGSEFEESYVLLDENPVSGQSLSYRLFLGNVGRSEVISLIFVPLIDGIAIYPNPASTEFTILLDKQIGEECNIEIIDIAGRIVYSLESTIDSMFAINSVHWHAGTYQIRAYNENFDIRKKLVIT